jgi:preprotein translocase subunit SecE
MRKNPIQAIRQFYFDTVAELKKCTWPTRSELKESTLVVIVSVFMLSAFVAIVDWVSVMVIRWLTVA